MTKGLDRSRQLLKFYPKAYREERGEEIVTTLQEAAEARVPRIALSDQISVAQYGLRIRLGLTSETMFGKALDIAAIPGLVMGAFFGLYLLILGDLPFANTKFFFPDLCSTWCGSWPSSRSSSGRSIDAASPPRA
jgi:hypothetical protein